MTLCTSRRERRLWGWTVTVLVVIYSTLGLARPLTGYLRYRRLLDGLVVLGLLLVGATILTQGLLMRPLGAGVSVVLGIMAACNLIFTRSIASAEEHTHLIECGLVDVFIYEALTERTRQGHCVPVPGLLAVLATAAGRPARREHPVHSAHPFLQIPRCPL